MMRFGIPYEFVLPQEQSSSFIKTLGEQGNDFLTMVSTLDMEKADAFSDYDKMQIKQLVLNHLGGYSKLNESVIGAIREFCLKKSLVAVSIMTEEEKAGSNLLENTGMMLSDLGDLDAALQLYLEALQLKEGRLGPSDASVAATKNNIGEVCRQLGRNEEAMKWYTEALEINEKCLGPLHPEVANNYNNMALVKQTSEDSMNRLNCM
jgi:tetratricopeptide (TPR) repeat protein